MFRQTKKKAADLAKELKREIQVLEVELSHKKELLSTLERFDREKPGVIRRGRPAGYAPRRGPAKKRGPVPAKGRGRRAQMPVRRKSKNRDIILAAATKLKGRFTLAQLKDEIHRKDPKFGGKYPSGTILAVLKTTPEIKKLKRGLYSYKK